MSVPNRLGKEGEELVVHRFPSGAKGLAALLDLQRQAIVFPRRKTLRSTLVEIGLSLRNVVMMPDKSRSVVAVCIPPGARLLLRDIPQRLQREMRVRHVEEVTFMQINADPFTYRDALRFANGREVSLQRLKTGQRVRVLNLSSADTASPELEWPAPAA